MNWTTLDWAALDRLREGFLHGTGAGPYWRNLSDLASYDLTYGERIGWKWDHVLRELRLRGWQPSARTILDWGCGSGIASRRVLGAFGASRFESLQLWDHSPLATGYAAAEAAKAFPDVRAVELTPGFLAGGDPVGLLLISHVLNELDPAALASLRALCARAEAVVWVEPGTHEVSRRLGAERDALLADFRVVAPCTHQRACPMFAPGRERDWCHFFAPPPSEIFANPDWVKFGQRAGVDLRSLPYAFIALERRTAAPGGGGPLTSVSQLRHESEEMAGLSRIIGRPEHFKPYARFLNCDGGGLAELTVPKRQAPELYKELERTKAPLVYRWQREGNEVRAGSRIGSSAAPGGAGPPSHPGGGA